VSGGAVRLFRDLVEAQKSGTAAGVVSVCSAHPVVLQAAMEQATEDGLPLLVESTVNQVNQFGGYTGLRPADFASFLEGLRAGTGFPADRLLLGADHFGGVSQAGGRSTRRQDGRRSGAKTQSRSSSF